MDKLSHDIDNFLHDILVNERRHCITDIENYIRLFLIGSVLLSFLCFLASAFVVYDDFLWCRSLNLDYTVLWFRLGWDGRLRLLDRGWSRRCFSDFFRDG